MPKNNDSAVGDLRFFAKIVGATVFVFFVFSRIYVFVHAWLHAHATLPDDMKFAILCKENPVLQRKVGHECQHVDLVGDWSPLEQGWLAMYNDTVSIFTSVLALVAIVSLLTAYMCAGAMAEKYQTQPTSAEDNRRGWFNSYSDAFNSKSKAI
jgi:hypothetical protein